MKKLTWQRNVRGIVGAGLLVVGMYSGIWCLWRIRLEWLSWGGDGTIQKETVVYAGGNAVETTMTVEIQGAILRPGIYQVPTNWRVVQLVVQSGGFSPDVDQVWVEQELNQADVLSDGQKMYIFRVGEASKKTTSSAKK